MQFSKIEITDLLKAWLFISLAFAILISGFSFDFKFFVAIVISGFTVGIGFLLHELAHKFVAQRYGCWAEFRADMRMLWLALLMSFFGVIFAAPGGVIIGNRIGDRKSGIIAAAGPLTNIILALIFVGIKFASQSTVITQIAQYGATINAWLAIFNMIPFFVFDGFKVLRWSKVAYASELAAAVGMMYLITL